MSADLNERIIEAKDFSLSVHINQIETSILNQLNFEANKNEVIGIVGMSGSGKSLFAMSLAGLLQDNKTFNLTGHFSYRDENHHYDLTSSSNYALLPYRKKFVSTIFQDPYASLNESLTCGVQIRDVLKLHEQDNSPDTIRSMLKEVGFDDADRAYNAYPYQLSGGECQRIVICIALASRPQIIIADEPTSSLDAAMEEEIIDHLLETRSSLGATLILISHDMKLISRYCDKIWVMHEGRFVSTGNFDQLKKTLDNAIVSNLFVEFEEKAEREEKGGSPLLQVKEVSVSYNYNQGWFSKKKKNSVLRDISFSIYPGEIVGLVGESGSGKSSLAKAIVRLVDIEKGAIYYQGQNLAEIPSNRLHAFRNDIQLILQDSYLSFNSAYSVSDALRQVWQNRNGNTDGFEDQIHSLFEQMGLSLDLLHSFPQQLSGGQRQRVMLVRAMIMQPQLLICDESVMALDPYIKKSILDILMALVQTDGISILFVSHDIESVRYICDRILAVADGVLKS